MHSDPLDTDETLVATLTDLLEGAIRRQCWILPLDDEQRPAGGIVILEDVPIDPDPEEVDHFASFVRRVLDETDSSSAVVVWERPGGPELRMLEADWAAAVAGTDLPLRAQLVLHDDGVRILDPAFEALVA